MPIHILMVDDHAIVREGYRALLEKQRNMRIVAEAGSGEEAYILYKQHRPNLLIMDLSLPDQSGIETISRIKKYDPAASILVFTMHQNPLIASKAIQAGARGYITKNNLPAVLIKAIYDVHCGVMALSQDIEKAIAIDRVAGPALAIKQLTVREFEILRLVVTGKSATEIAEILNISPKTVANCHYLIKRKLRVSNDIELTHLAIKMHVINPVEEF
ncbi:response regulator [Methylophaga pinxianii]|uniref:response regulator n=1 Tax=Methylophaga pinxianii TaxID=2881052 RepID=UPI001CF2C2AF|nr:response regulator transcription factor [Methylophaga pinxianii]MCB2427942.1 response regulator transcription factor [Methylophaga pinxianii]UPH44433.1 response regulator transcription factor [Methylophaga pinxianii]